MLQNKNLNTNNKVKINGIHFFIPIFGETVT